MSARSFPLNAEGHITPCNRCFTTRTRFASLSALKQVHTVRAVFLRVHETSGGGGTRPAPVPRPAAAAKDDGQCRAVPGDRRAAPTLPGHHRLGTRSHSGARPVDRKNRPLPAFSSQVLALAGQ